MYNVQFAAKNYEYAERAEAVREAKAFSSGYAGQVVITSVDGHEKMVFRKGSLFEFYSDSPYQRRHR